jgi:hypothetical protein
MFASTRHSGLSNLIPLYMTPTDTNQHLMAIDQKIADVFANERYEDEMLSNLNMRCKNEKSRTSIHPVGK